MTLRELYERVDGSYDQALKIMMYEALIEKHIRKLESSPVGEAMAAASESMDAAMLFEAAHSMKGMCANLGLTGLAAAAGVIADEFRPGSPRRLSDEAVKAKLAEINRRYSDTLQAIREYDAQG